MSTDDGEERQPSLRPGVVEACSGLSADLGLIVKLPIIVNSEPPADEAELDRLLAELQTATEDMLGDIKRARRLCSPAGGAAAKGGSDDVQD